MNSFTLLSLGSFKTYKLFVVAFDEFLNTSLSYSYAHSISSLVKSLLMLFNKTGMGKIGIIDPPGFCCCDIL